MNSNLNGLSIDQINLGMISLLKEQAGIDSGIVSDVLDAVAEAIGEDEDLQIYTSGATMEACTRILLEAGISEVYILSICIGIARD